MQEVEDKTGLIRRFLRMRDRLDEIQSAVEQLKTLNYRQYEDPRIDALLGDITRAAQGLKE